MKKVIATLMVLLLAALAQAHENFIFNTPCGIGGQRSAGIHVIAAHGLD